MAVTKRLPNKVYVLGHEYAIEEMSERLFKEREAYGDCDNEQKKIRIYCGTIHSVTRDTLLHEILHAASAIRNLSSNSSQYIKYYPVRIATVPSNNKTMRR